jgi:hypothetical protein
VPKPFADVSPIRQLPNRHLRCEASLWGHFLFGLDIPPMRVQTGIVRAVASRRINSRPWLAYKYIPSLDGPPHAEYPTITCNDTRLEKLWLGKTGSVRLGNAEAEHMVQMKPLMDALAALPVVQPVQSLHIRGSSTLRYDRSRRLR